MATLSSFGCSDETEVVYEHFIGVEVHGARGNRSTIRAQRRGDSGELTIDTVARPLESGGMQTAFLSCPPGSYTVSVSFDQGRYYYGSGTSRPLEAQADPVVVGPGLETPRIAFHFGEVEINLHMTNPNRQPEEFIRLEVVTPTLRTQVSTTSLRYFGPVDEVIETWRPTLAPGRYRIRAQTANGQYSYLQTRSRFGLSDFVDVSPSDTTSYTVELGPPGKLLFHIDAPEGIGEFLRLNFYDADSNDPLREPFQTSLHLLSGVGEAIEMEMWPRGAFLIDSSIDVGPDPKFLEARWLDSYKRYQARSFDFVFAPGKTSDVYYFASTVSLSLDMSVLDRSSLPLLEFFDLDGKVVYQQEFLTGVQDTVLVRVPNLLPGDYRLRISSTAGFSFPPQYYPTAFDDPESAEILTLTAGEEVALQWELSAGFRTGPR